MWKIAELELKSRFILGTARFPTLEILQKSIQQSGVEIVTISLRRQSAGDGGRFWEMIHSLGVRILPNTAGCRSVKEAVATAHMARELFKTNWIKLETVGDEYTLQPDPFALVEAARILISDGFEVFPYTTDDLVIAERLVAMGCRILMPWASPIGSGQGIVNPMGLRTLRTRFPQVSLIIDAGIGTPSDAAYGMELGFDAVLLNSAVALSPHPIQMAGAFARAIEAGRMGFEAGIIPSREFAQPSTPVIGMPFWHGENLV